MKLKAIHKKRLRKLIDFLRELPRRKFDFAEIRTEVDSCGAIGCAIGWASSVFPRQIEAVESNWGAFVRLRKGADELDEFAQVAEWVSGLVRADAENLFHPNRQTKVHAGLEDLSDNATPKQVARMLEKFIELHS